MYSRAKIFKSCKIFRTVFRIDSSNKITHILKFWWDLYLPQLQRTRSLFGASSISSRIIYFKMFCFFHGMFCHILVSYHFFCSVPVLISCFCCLLITSFICWYIQYTWHFRSTFSIFSLYNRTMSNSSPPCCSEFLFWLLFENWLYLYLKMQI